MASLESKVQVWTIESTDVGQYQPTKEPYRRIVAVADQAGKLSICRGIGVSVTQTCVVTPEEIEFASPDQAGRFISYFCNVVAPNDPQEPDVANRPEANYNCYAAAIAIAGLEQRLGWREAFEVVKRLHATCTTFGEPVPLGGLGLLVHEVLYHDNPIEHSFIAVRTNRSSPDGRDLETVGVLSIGGPMGIMTYDQMESYYWAYGIAIPDTGSGS